MLKWDEVKRIAVIYLNFNLARYVSKLLSDPCDSSKDDSQYGCFTKARHALKIPYKAISLRFYPNILNYSYKFKVDSFGLFTEIVGSFGCLIVCPLSLIRLGNIFLIYSVSTLRGLFLSSSSTKFWETRLNS